MATNPFSSFGSSSKGSLTEIFKNLPQLVMEGIDSQGIVNIVRTGDANGDDPFVSSEKPSMYDDISKIVSDPIKRMEIANSAINVLINDNPELMEKEKKQAAATLAVRQSVENNMDIDTAGTNVASFMKLNPSDVISDAKELDAKFIDNREMANDQYNPTGPPVPVGTPTTSELGPITQSYIFGQPGAMPGSVPLPGVRDVTQEDIAGFQGTAESALSGFPTEEPETLREATIINENEPQIESRLTTSTIFPPGSRIGEPPPTPTPNTGEQRPLYPGGMPPGKKLPIEYILEGKNKLSKEELSDISYDKQYIEDFDVKGGIGKLFLIDDNVYAEVDREGIKDYYDVGKNESTNAGEIDIPDIDRSYSQTLPGVYTSMSPDDTNLGSYIFGDDKYEARSGWSDIRTQQMGDKAFNPKFYETRDLGFAPAWNNFSLTGPIRGEGLFSEFYTGRKDNPVTPEQRAKGWDSIKQAAYAIKDLEFAPGDTGKYQSYLSGPNSKQYMVDTALAAANINPDTTMGKNVSSFISNRYDIENSRSSAQGTMDAPANFVDWFDKAFMSGKEKQMPSSQPIQRMPVKVPYNIGRVN